MRPRLYLENKHYFIAFLTSEDETTLMMTEAENDENEVLTQGVIKPPPPPTHTLPISAHASDALAWHPSGF